ncbi:MAG: hypothetical protein MJZ02_02910 [Paludibacteraceae bacterium]|nr:hypothetical protein [Paludibacteraceae bacterium]
MKHQNITFGLLLCSVPFGMQAQENAESNTDTTVSRQIEIVKEYNPTIKEASKISTTPELKDNGTKKMDVNYSVWATPITPGNDSVPALDFALAGHTNKEYKRTGFLKLGAGNHVSFLGETYLPIYQTKKDLVEVYGKHNSTSGKVRMTDYLYSDLNGDFRTKAKLNDNFLKASYTHNIDVKELSAYLDYGYNGFNYYGYDGRSEMERDSTPYNRKQAFTNFDAGIRFRSKKFINKWSFDAQTNYQLFRTRDGLKEHNIFTDLGGAMLVDNGHLNLDLQMFNIFTSLPDEVMPFNYATAANTDNETVFILRPAYVIKGKRSELNIGVKAAFSIGQGRPASVMPDLMGNIAIIPDYWFLYAGITGDYTINNYRNMAKINRYIALDNRAEDTYTPIDVYVGSKINLFKYALLDVNIGYKIINNPYYFISDNCDTTATNAKGSFYNLEYGKDEGLFTAGLGLTTGWKELIQLNLKGKYNKWAMGKDETPWMMPKTEFTATVSSVPIEDLRVWVAYNFLGGRKALFRTHSGENYIVKEHNMRNLNDLSLGATYKAMSWLDIFLHVNNILSKEYDYWYGNPTQHFNIMGGVVVNF